VPAKLSAQVRVFATGNGRKTDPVDAHSVALVALRTPNLVRVHADPELVVMSFAFDDGSTRFSCADDVVQRGHRPRRPRLSPYPARRSGSSNQPIE
jgi:hypothetical protein